MELENGEIIEYNLFSATWSYSRLHCFVYTKTKTTEDFIRCLLEVLYQSSGAPKEILTDNMSAVVSVRGSRKTKHKQIENFEKDTGIKIRLCQVRSPQTKGKCESANRYVQWLQPYQKKLETEEDLLKQIHQLNTQINRETNQTTGVPPVVLFKKKKEHLDPLPSNAMLESYLHNISVRRCHQHCWSDTKEMDTQLTRSLLERESSSFLSTINSISTITRSLSPLIRSRAVHLTIVRMITLRL